MQEACKMASLGKQGCGGEGGHVQVGHREGNGAVHLLGGSLVSGFEALHVQAQHWRQLAYGHLLEGCPLALTPAHSHAAS